MLRAFSMKMTSVMQNGSGLSLHLPSLTGVRLFRTKKNSKNTFTMAHITSEERSSSRQAINRNIRGDRSVIKRLSNADAKRFNKNLDMKDKLKGKEGLLVSRSTTKLLGVAQNDIEQTVESIEYQVSSIKGLLELNTSICSGCGTQFQSKSPDNPGYLSKEKFKEHRIVSDRINTKKEALKLLEMARIDAESDMAEEILVAAKIPSEIIDSVRDMHKGQIKKRIIRKREIAPPPERVEGDTITVAELKALESGEKATFDAVCICERCFKLQQYGQVQESLRSGWSQNELLSPERFQSLLSNIRDTRTVVLCLVDLFDMQGSLLPNLRQIAGSNPIVIAANKIDLLPEDVERDRVTSWVHSEVKEVCNMRSPYAVVDGIQVDQRVGQKGENAEEGVLRRGNVHLVSCETGVGMNKLLSHLMALAVQNGDKVHVMGAANVGKSSFINRLLETKYRLRRGEKLKRLRKNMVPLATVSNLPGTTLDFLKIRLPNGVTMIDTPGLMNKGQLTAKLSPEELRKVIPRKRVNPLTLRVMEGKCILAGGLAVIELVEGRPFFFTVYMSNEIKLHYTDSARAASFLEKHIGTLTFPPATIERVRALGPFVSHDFEVEGTDFKSSSYDIVIAGLGWISVTGPGLAKVRITVPEGTNVVLRPSLLPSNVKATSARFTGSRFIRKSVKGRPGLGYRA